MATAKIESNSLISDARLERALELFESEQIAVLSLDVFDTLVWRTVPEPADAFLILGKRLLEADLLRPSASPEAFAKLRVISEWEARKKAKKRHGFPEVTLAEIYEAFPAQLLIGSVDQALQLEVELEREITVPDLAVFQFVHKIQAEHDVRVILVSDTYYSSSQVNELIFREGVSPFEIEKIFVSSQHMVGKGKGLFRVVLNWLNLDASKVMHMGDNKDADVKMPKRLSIRAVHYAKYTDDLLDLIEAETAQPPEHHKMIGGRTHLDAGDGGITALRSRLLGSSERELLPAELEPYWRFGATVLGPTFTGFAEWVLSRAESEGAKHVYCLMREGDFLSDLFNRARSYLSSPVVARQLWLSRLLCARASVFKCDAKELQSFWKRRRPPTLKELCRTLGISPDQVPGFEDYNHIPLANKKRVKQLIKALTTSTEIRRQILQNSADVRERLFDYIDKVREAEAENGDRMIIADLGWSLSTQGELEKVLKGTESSINLLGLYLLTAEGANLRFLEGIEAEGFLGNCGIPKRSEWIVRSPEVLEQLCMPEEGSVVDILGGEPQLTDYKGDKIREAQKQAVRSGILAFQVEWARYVEAFPALRGCLSSGLQPLLLNHVARFVSRPTVEEASLFSGWCHEDNYGSDAEGKLVPEGLSEIITHANPAVFERMVQQSDIYWPSGLLTLHDPEAAEAYAAVVDNRVSADAFVNLEKDIWVESYVDKGAGFHAKEGIFSRLIFNKYGLSFFEGTFYEKGIQAVRFDPCGFPALLRLNWVKLTLWHKDREEPTVLRLESPKDLSRLEYHEIVPWDGNLVVCTGKDPWFACRFNRFGVPLAESVHIQVAFAIFPYAIPTPEKVKKSEKQMIRSARRLAGRARRMPRSVGRRLMKNKSPSMKKRRKD